MQPALLTAALLVFACGACLPADLRAQGAGDPPKAGAEQTGDPQTQDPQTQDPKPTDEPEAPKIPVPEDAAAAGALDLLALKADLEKQDVPRLRELFVAWDQLLRDQETRIEESNGAEDGTPEKERLPALQSDRDAVLEQMEAILATLRSRGEVELDRPEEVRALEHLDAIKQKVEPEKIDVKKLSDEELEQARKEQLEKISTVPENDAAALAVSLPVLRAQLRPLTRSQVKTDLEGWINLLQTKALAIRRVEVSAFRAEESDEVERFNERAVALRTEQQNLISRVQVVTKSLERKGGDVTDYEAYLDSLREQRDVVTLDQFLIQARASVYNWLYNPEGGIAWLLAILRFVAVLVVFRFLSSFVSKALNHGLRRLKKSNELLRDFVVTTSRKAIGLVGWIVAVSQLGIDIAPLVAAIGAAGFVVAFALQGTLSNFASGVMLMLYQPYDVGDVVIAGGVNGSVSSMNLVSTTIKTFDNQSIVVPNNRIWGDVITNVTANPTRRIDLVFGISYSDDVDKARQLLEEVLSKHPKTLDDPAPMVRVHELGDNSVNLIARPWCRTSDYWEIFWDLQREVKQRFDAENISIPFPQRDVHVYQHATADGPNGTPVPGRGTA